MNEGYTNRDALLVLSAVPILPLVHVTRLLATITRKAAVGVRTTKCLTISRPRIRSPAEVTKVRFGSGKVERPLRTGG